MKKHDWRAQEALDKSRMQTLAMGFVVGAAVIWGMMRALTVALKQSEQGLAVHNDIIRRNERDVAGMRATYITRDSIRAAIVTAGVLVGIFVSLHSLKLL